MYKKIKATSIHTCTSNLKKRAGTNHQGCSLFAASQHYSLHFWRHTLTLHRVTAQTHHAALFSRSQSTLGRFSKSTGRLPSRTAQEERVSQTLPRHASRYERPLDRDDGTINVSIINTVSSPRPLANGGPAKPARTYKSNLSRSKSLNVREADDIRSGMYKSNPTLHRLDETPLGLKSPGLISSLSRSQRDLNGGIGEEQEKGGYTGRFAKNGFGDGLDRTRNG